MCVLFRLQWWNQCCRCMKHIVYKCDYHVCYNYLESHLEGNWGTFNNIVSAGILSIHMKDRGCSVWWKGWNGIGIISGSCGAGNGITRHGFYSNFSTASRRWTRKTSSYRGWIGRGIRDRREFRFRSRYFRFRPWHNPWSFRVYIRAYNYLRSTGAWLTAQNHTSRSGR